MRLKPTLILCALASLVIVRIVLFKDGQEMMFKQYPIMGPVEVFTSPVTMFEEKNFDQYSVNHSIASNLCLQTTLKVIKAAP
jgi:hypothetical protein